MGVWLPKDDHLLVELYQFISFEFQHCQSINEEFKIENVLIDFAQFNQIIFRVWLLLPTILRWRDLTICSRSTTSLLVILWSQKQILTVFWKITTKIIILYWHFDIVVWFYTGRSHNDFPYLLFFVFIWPC